MLLEDADIARAVDDVLEAVTDPKLDVRWAYMAGRQPKVWVTAKMRELFQKLADSFSENYCGLAVKARLARLKVEGWSGPDAAAAEEVWDRSGFKLRQKSWYRWALTHSRAYLVPDTDADDRPILTALPATMCWAEPDPNDWAGSAWAGKAWTDGRHWHAVIWDEAQVWSLTAPDPDAGKGARRRGRSKPAGKSFMVDDGYPRAHGFDKVPAIGAHPFGADGPPLIDDIAGIQDKINKLGSNKFVTAEFAAFVQRVFFTRQEVSPYDLRNSPDHAIILDPGEEGATARVQELTPSDITLYDQSKNAEVDALFTIATLPRHLRVNPGATPSGAAIRADEGPFVEDVESAQEELGQAIVAALALLGIDAEPVWKPVEVSNDLEAAQTVKSVVDSGVPWQYAVQRYLGWTEEDVRDAEDIAKEAGADMQKAVSAALAAAMANPQQPEVTGEPTSTQPPPEPPAGLPPAQ